MMQTNGEQMWADRLTGIISRLNIFMKNNVLFEVACEEIGTCNIDQRSFKAYLARWMAATAVKAPFTYPLLKPILEASAMAAVSTCNGGDDGNQCGQRWYQGTNDGSLGVGEQMCALEVVQSNLIDYAPGPVSANTGGTSKGDPNAGTTSKINPDDLHQSQVTTADKAGAAILTLGVVALVVGGAWWLIT
jgi:mannan endo-1,6-alpha-mannosidase